MCTGKLGEDLLQLLLLGRKYSSVHLSKVLLWLLLLGRKYFSVHLSKVLLWLLLSGRKYYSVHLSKCCSGYCYWGENIPNVHYKQSVAMIMRRTTPPYTEVNSYYGYCCSGGLSPPFRGKKELLLYERKYTPIGCRVAVVTAAGQEILL